MKREIFSDAAVFRRGFYSCPEEHHDALDPYFEMRRMDLPKNPEAVKKDCLKTHLIRKKVRVIYRRTKKMKVRGHRRKPHLPK